MDAFAERKADLIVEVAHPSISKSHGAKFLQFADYMVGSPTAFADSEIEESLRRLADNNEGRGVYVPAGALWGAEDIKKMADRGTLTGLTVTMKKHPASLKVESELKPKLAQAFKPASGEVVVYDGPVRGLCPLAPNNVNTMACAALAAHNIGFDKVRARLIADSSLDAHVIFIEVQGPPASNTSERGFSVTTERYNPAKVGAVTGSATYVSFLSSLLGARGAGAGFHFC